MAGARGSVLIALLLILLGGGIALAIQKADILPALSLTTPVIAGAVLLNIEHTFYEYLYAAGKNRLAAIVQGLAAAAMLAGLLLCEGVEDQRLIPAAGAGALLSLVAALAAGVLSGPRPNGQLLRRAPWALFFTALYPALAFGLHALIKQGRLPQALGLYDPGVSYLPPESASLAPFDGLIAGFFAGWLLISLYRTAFRRSGAECAPMNRTLAIIALAAALLWGACVSPLMMLVSEGGAPFFTALPAFCAMVLLACICAFALYGGIAKKGE